MLPFKVTNCALLSSEGWRKRMVAVSKRVREREAERDCGVAATAAAAAARNTAATLRIA